MDQDRPSSWERQAASRALLNDDGYVVVSLPNVAHWEVQFALLQGRFEYTREGLLDDSHLRFFTYDTALKLIREAGFEIEVFDVVHKCPWYWRYQRAQRLVHYLVKGYLRGIYGYQFIFKLRPRSEGRCGR